MFVKEFGSMKTATAMITWKDESIKIAQDPKNSLIPLGSAVISLEKPLAAGSV
jgi:hypothetical protein